MGRPQFPLFWVPGKLRWVKSIFSSRGFHNHTKGQISRLGFPSGFPGPVASVFAGRSLDKQVHSPQTYCIRNSSVRLREIYSNKPSRWSWNTLKFENSRCNHIFISCSTCTIRNECRVERWNLFTVLLVEAEPSAKGIIKEQAFEWFCRKQGWVRFLSKRVIRIWNN